jgi:very-short-patch-repair endonuclease
VAAGWQLVPLGVTRDAIRHGRRSGWLHPVHRDVYAVGHRALGLRGVHFAAVLACGPHAVLSHRSAAHLWDVRRTSRSAVDVIVPGRSRMSRKGIDVHRVRHLEPRDVTALDGIPVTTLARTLLDLAEVVPEDHVAKAMEQAERRRLLDLRALEELLDRSPGRRGQRPLRSILRDAALEPGIREELERRFARLVQEAGLSRPLFNTLVEGYEVDAYWPDAKLIVELDGYEFHRTRKSFEADRQRDATLLLAGYRVVRFTWRQLTRQPRAVIATVRRLLTAR